MLSVFLFFVYCCLVSWLRTPARPPATVTAPTAPVVAAAPAIAPVEPVAVKTEAVEVPSVQAPATPEVDLAEVDVVSDLWVEEPAAEELPEKEAIAKVIKANATFGQMQRFCRSRKIPKYSRFRSAQSLAAFLANYVQPEDMWALTS